MRKSALIAAALLFGLISAAPSYARKGETVESSSASCEAPKVALKTNLIYDATATINLGVEFAIAPKLTIDISGNYHPWVLPNERRLTHALVQPELRWWFKENFKGHFVAVNALAADFNVGNLPNNITIMGQNFSPLGRYRMDGIAYGAGLAYGYAFRICRHLNIELEAGVGYLVSNFSAYKLTNDNLYAKNTMRYYGPTKAALNIVYLF